MGTFARLIRRTFSVFLVASLFYVPITPLAPVVSSTASAQTLLDALFGRSRHYEQRRQVVRKRVYPTRRVVRQNEYRPRTIRRSEPRQVRRSQPRQSRSAASSPSHSSGSAAVQRVGTFRTLCVRKEDGYFFPISFSTTADYFATDLQACQARCPGADVDLYVHRVLRDETEQMVNYKTEEPYANLSNAFRFKKDGVSEAASKACRLPPKNLRIEVAEGLGPMPFDSPIPMPGWRPDPLELAADDAQIDEAPSEVAEVSERPRIVRQVGPRFFPDQ